MFARTRTARSRKLKMIRPWLWKFSENCHRSARLPRTSCDRITPLSPPIITYISIASFCLICIKYVSLTSSPLDQAELNYTFLHNTKSFRNAFVLIKVPMSIFDGLFHHHCSSFISGSTWIYRTFCLIVKVLRSEFFLNKLYAKIWSFLSDFCVVVKLMVIRKILNTLLKRRIFLKLYLPKLTCIQPTFLIYL